MTTEWRGHVLKTKNNGSGLILESKFWTNQRSKGREEEEGVGAPEKCWLSNCTIKAATQKKTTNNNSNRLLSLSRCRCGRCRWRWVARLDEALAELLLEQLYVQCGQRHLCGILNDLLNLSLYVNMLVHVCKRQMHCPQHFILMLRAQSLFTYTNVRIVNTPHPSTPSYRSP